MPDDFAKKVNKNNILHLFLKKNTFKKFISKILWSLQYMSDKSFR